MWLIVASLSFIAYGVYILCQEDEVPESQSGKSHPLELTDEPDEEPIQKSAEQEVAEKVTESKKAEERSDDLRIKTGNPLIDGDYDKELDDIWSSYHLDRKYDEMKEKKELRRYLNLDEWKRKVRRRFKSILYSKDYKSQPSNYIERSRAKRAPNEYAVVEDTTLNLLEYYELMSSQDQQMVEMKEFKKDNEGLIHN